MPVANQAARTNLRIRELPVRLIYHDATRHFGGILDDPTVRLAHYVEVFEAECKARPTAPIECTHNRVAPCALCQAGSG